MTGSSNLLKVAVIGCGKIADGHVEQIRATGMAEPVAVCDREPLMARQLAMRWSVPHWYSDVSSMLEAEKPDVVHIATPPDSHLSLAKAGLQAGCHIFMEKPFALDARQTREILELAAASGRRIAVNYLYNFETPYLQLMDQVRAGALGEIVHLETIYGYSLAGDYGLALLSDPDHWVHRLPGKLFHNLLDHVLAKAAPFFGSDVMSAQAQTLRLRPTSADAALDSMADELRFLLRVGDLTIGGLISAHIRPVQHSLRVYGTKGSLVLDIGSRTCVPVVAQTFPSAAGRLLPAWIQSRHYRRNARENLRRFCRHEFHFFQGMRVLLRGFYAAIQGQGSEPLPPAIIQGTAVAIDTVLAGMHTRAAGVTL